MLKLNKQKNRKKIIFIVILIFLILVAIGAYMYIERKNNSNVGPRPEPIKIDGVNYEPPTEEEKKAGDDMKEEIVKKEQEQTENSMQDGKVVANIVIASSTLDEVRAYVSNVVEEGGECSATFSQGETVIKRSSSGFANASYTQCAPITPDLPNKNAWKLEVQYTSSKTFGKSNIEELSQ